MATYRGDIRNFRRRLQGRKDRIEAAIQPLLPHGGWYMLGYDLIDRSTPLTGKLTPVADPIAAHGVELCHTLRILVYEKYMWDGLQAFLTDYCYEVRLGTDADEWIVRYEIHGTLEDAPEWAARSHLHVNPEVPLELQGLDLTALHFPNLVEAEVEFTNPTGRQEGRRSAVLPELLQWLGSSDFPDC